MGKDIPKLQTFWMLELQKGSKLGQAFGKCSTSIVDDWYLIGVILCFRFLACSFKLAQLAMAHEYLLQAAQNT